MTDRPSFKQEIEALEKVVRQLEGDDVDLDRALQLFEDGVKHLKSARALLTEAELKVRKVVAEADGIADEPLDV